MRNVHGARGKLKDAIKSFPARLKAMREDDAGLTQEKWIPLVNAASVELFGEGLRVYSQSTYSRLESGRQKPSLFDVAVMAACDPKARGVLWMAYDTTDDFSMGDTIERAPTAAEALAQADSGVEYVATPARKRNVR